jgi:ParB family chromosome partitioning protein
MLAGVSDLRGPRATIGPPSRVRGRDVRRTVARIDARDTLKPGPHRPKLAHIRIDIIDIPPERIRHDLGSIDDLANSLAMHGLLHPIQVCRAGRRFRLIAGERRLRAARSLAWQTIEARVWPAHEAELLLELVENTQRKHLSDEEEADALIRLVRDRGHEAKDVAVQVGRSEAYVSKRVRVFEDPVLRQTVLSGSLSVSVVEEFLAIHAEERPPLVAEAVAGRWEGWRVRQAIRDGLKPLPQGAARDTVIDGISSEGSTETRLRGQTGDLGRQVRTLTRVLRQIKASELSSADQRALAELLETLLRLARASSRASGSGPVFPSLEEARRATRGGKR